MRILIDIGHPAHIHYFKYMIKALTQKGFTFHIVARNRKHIFPLLKHENLNFVDRGKGKDTLLSKLIYLPKGVFTIIREGLKFHPDILIGFGSMYAAIASKFLFRPSIIFDDTESATFGHILYKPFAKYIFTPECFKKEFGSKQIRFNGYMELCYLHPDYFEPDKGVLRSLELKPDDKFVVMRFVSWKANHDLGHSGLHVENKIKAVEEISKHAKVFISSEGILPEKLVKYKLNIPSEKIHDLLYFAALTFGESSTMASESAVLGTPAIYIDNVGRGYTDEEEIEYGLVFNFTESLEDQNMSIKKAVQILQDTKNDHWLSKRKRLLKDKIDVTKFITWFFENFPDSVEVLNKNPGYQNNFCS